MKIFNETTKLSRLTRSEINMVSGGICECYSDLHCNQKDNIGHGGGHRGTLSECMDSCKSIRFDVGSCKFNGICYNLLGLLEWSAKAKDTPHHFSRLSSVVADAASGLLSYLTK